MKALLKEQIKPERGIWLPSCSQPSWSTRVVTHVFWWVDTLLQFLLPCQASLLNTAATQLHQGPLMYESEILSLQCQTLIHSKPDDFLAPHGSLVAHFQLCCCTRWKLLFDLLYLNTHLPFGKHLEVPIRLNNRDNLRLVEFTFTFTPLTKI